MSQQKPYENGQSIEYRPLKDQTWRKCVYIGINPSDDRYHVIQTAFGAIFEVFHDRVRLPKVKKEGWVNIYKENPDARTNMGVGGIYPSKEKAQSMAHEGVVDTVKIEWEEQT